MTPEGETCGQNTVRFCPRRLFKDETFIGRADMPLVIGVSDMPPLRCNVSASIFAKGTRSTSRSIPHGSANAIKIAFWFTVISADATS